MPWLVLVGSAAFEAVWATALGASDGLTQLLPSLVFLLGLVASTLGLAHAVRSIPIGTAYAVWTGLGAALTVSYAVAVGNESLSWGKTLCLAAIVGAVVGLKLLEEDRTANDDGSAA